MTVRKVIYLPDPRLRAATATIEVFDDELQTLVDDMIETMYAANGVGLAATQIGISKKIAVLDASRERNQPMVIINPEVTALEGSELMDEGCLSVPGAYDRAPRATKVKLKAQDRYGEVYEMEADGLLAHVIQHEVDHLNSKLFVDYLSPLKKHMAMKKLEKHKRREG